jgi:DNA polymerase
MSDNEQQLYEDILNFLEYEKEVYGAFALSESPVITQEKTVETTQDESNVEEETEEYISNESKQPKTLEEKLEACSSLEELRDLCKSAEELKTDLENTNLVFGVGNSSADLMIVGEAPGHEEDRQGEPFVGKAGQLLNKILKAIDFEREDVYIANILKHRPPGNRNPNPDERLRSLPYLIRQIDLIDPKIILCVGKVSGTTLLKKEDSLRNLRGQFYPFRGAELTVTYHPAALLRNPQWKRPTWDDVQKVRKRYDELGGKP